MLAQSLGGRQCCLSCSLPVVLAVVVVLLQLLQLPGGAGAEDDAELIEITAEQAAQIIEEDGSVIDGNIISEGASTEVSAAPAAVDLTAANFDMMLTNGSTWLVMFYAPWCGHCQRMAPMIESIAADYANAPNPVDWNGRPRVSVGRVDATKDAALGVRFLIDSFPTLILVEGGLLPTFRYYTGRRAESDIRDYIEGEYLDTDDARAWWHPLNPMAPWFTWVFLLHPLRILYSLVLPSDLMGIAATGVLVVAMLPVYIVIICALLIALLETLGACQRWRRGEVMMPREEADVSPAEAVSDADNAKGAQDDGTKASESKKEA
jgi:thiol-disulfide isomerase/thioredoxin